MPVPVHQDEPLSRCAFCPSVFLARTALDTSFIVAHEASCPGNPDRSVWNIDGHSATTATHACLVRVSVASPNASVAPSFPIGFTTKSI